MLNLSAEASAALDERLRTEDIAWITTVTADGQPQSSPVWFLWDDAEYSTALRITPTRVRVY